MKARRFMMFVVWAGLAMWSASANAACYSPRQQLPPSVISTFLANPDQLLERFGSGGAIMTAEVRDLAGSDPATLAAIVGLVAKANSNQLKAIGAGLGQAARVCARTDQAFADQIQQAVAGSNNSELVLAYTSATGNVQIGGLGGGGGPGGGGGSGTGGPIVAASRSGGGTGPAQNFGGSTTTNSFTNLLGAGAVGTTTTIATSVSPF